MQLTSQFLSPLPSQLGTRTTEPSQTSAPPAADQITLGGSAEDLAAARQIASSLAARLNVNEAQVSLLSLESGVGFNPSNMGFPVNGELQISARTQGLEAKFQHDGQGYVYRGLDASSGRYGQDIAHQGYWEADERGIYVPDKNAPVEEW